VAIHVSVRKLALVVALLLVAVAAPSRAHSQNQQATVTLVAPKSVSASADHVDVRVDVANAQNLAGFQFVLGFDSRLLKPVSVEKTPLLTQSGRELFCADPTIEPGAIRYTCVTLRLTPAGVDGSGTLAVVTLKPLATGTSVLALTHVELVHPDGSDLSITSVDGKLALSGNSNPWLSPWRLAAEAGAAALLVLLLGALVWRRRPRESPPERDPESFTVEP
jgi:hypothetical protein